MLKSQRRQGMESDLAMQKWWQGKPDDFGEFKRKQEERNQMQQIWTTPLETFAANKEVANRGSKIIKVRN